MCMDFLKNSQNKVLVCLPVYNAEDCLSSTIKSILRQTFKQFDVLVIDNQSTDHTVDVFHKFKRDFDTENKIHIIANKENLGRIGNWNQCIEILKQTHHLYLKFVFSGDRLEDDCLEKMVNIFIKNPSLGLVSSGYYVHTFGNKIEKKVSFGKNMHFTPVQALESFVQRGNWVGAPISCMFSRGAIDGVKFSEGIEWAADWKFYIDITKRFDSFYISEPLSNFHAPQRKYFIKHETDPATRTEELLVKQYALKKLEDLNPDIAASLKKNLYKTEGEYLFQSLSLFDILALTIYKLAKIFKNILRNNSF